MLQIRVAPAEGLFQNQELPAQLLQRHLARLPGIQ